MMVSVTIALSDEQLALAKAQALEGGFSALEDYIQSLITGHLDRKDNDDFGAPEQLRAASIEQFKTMIEDGLKSPAREMTKADFEQMRQELVERHRKSKAG
jgi:hypothetical protein